LREPHGRQSILLAEDNAVNQKLAVWVLEKRGHTVVENLEKQSFDLVLIDVQMLEMDGLEATAMIRSREKKSGKHIPIVAVSANAIVGDRERCLEAGMDGYVSKPQQVKELFAAIEQCVSPATEMVSM
jgi:two-component system, sensor histidine kinase and response regulator